MTPRRTNLKKNTDPIPKDEQQALDWLLPVLDLEAHTLQGVPKGDFKQAWYGIAFLYAGLHPDEALDHGTTLVEHAEDYPFVSRVEPRLLQPYYEKSGWPVVLAPVAAEAWRRYETGSLKDDELYCSDAQLAGMQWRFRQQPIP